jgi:signal transduction histidine kinase/ActR/RegA family two-component response regulator
MDEGDAAEEPRAQEPGLPLLWKYLVSLLAVVVVPLIGYTATQVWFSTTGHRDALRQLQRANVKSAAIQITQFVRDIERQLRWVTHLSWSEGTSDQIRLDAFRTLRQSPPITDLTVLDAQGRERLFVSRVSIDRIDAGTDWTGREAYERARANGVYYGPVRFVRDTEPSMTLAVFSGQGESGVVVAEVNLRDIHDIVASLRVGESGKAYVLDSRHRLIAHPDSALVLRNTDLSYLANELDRQGGGDVHALTSPEGSPVLVSQELMDPLAWRVIVELPESEANQPLRSAVQRSLWITLGSIAVALSVGAFLALRMVVPIRILTGGARLIGEGKLSHRIHLNTGDEIEVLSHQFNSMATALEASYTTLERKVEDRTRALRDANQAKSRFLAAASHDLRQPLHALNLLVAQLRTTDEPAEREQLTQRVESAVGSINGLFDALLDISKLDAGVVTTHVAPFPVQRILDRMDAAFSADAVAKGLELRIRPSKAWLRSDPILMERIVGNLVGNALRYTRRGGLLIGCRRDANGLRIEVWDTGVGIPKDKHQQVFEEFFQLASGAGLRGEGLGLGLAIVARLCQLLGHDVSLGSVPGRGSCFRVRVPAAAPDDGHSEVPSALLVGPGNLYGRTVLVVDNDPTVLESTVGLLTAWGCDVRPASDLGTALAQIAHAPLDLIVADVHLANTEEDGFAVIEHVRRKLGLEVPAVLVSGDVSAHTRDRARMVSLTLIEKPVVPMRLRAALSRLLSATALRREAPNSSAQRQEPPLSDC